METKVCTKCFKELTTDKFGMHKGGKDGLSSFCNKCNRHRGRIYREENKDKEKERAKKYRENNVDKILESSRRFARDNKHKISEYMKKYAIENPNIIIERHRKYRKNNKDKIAESSKIYYKKNSERLLESGREYREMNSDKVKESHKRYREENRDKERERHEKYREENPDKARESSRKYGKANRDKCNIKYHRYQAKKRILLSTFTDEQWEYAKLYFKNLCCYCGRKLPLTQEHFVCVNNGGEYTHENIIPACGSCNSSKKDKDFNLWFPKYKYYSKQREKFIIEYLNYIKENNQQLSTL